MNLETPADLVLLVATGLVITVAAYSYALALYGRRARIPKGTVEQPLFFAILVPCLNEATVIGRTLRTLLAMRGRFHVVVLDDSSDDGSQEVVRGFPSRMVTLVERRGADSRVGKGAALNNGFREVITWNLEQLYGDPNVIVTVFDSDSRVPVDFLEQVAPYFADPHVVGVQTEVRMYNRDQNRLTFWQHLEFAAWGQVFARGKDRLGSATLGGNGQCVRLSSLKSLGPAPWRPSLTEDLDLSLRLLVRGGRVRFTDTTYVDQEAVGRIHQLVRQRARWVQGHLVAWEHLGAIAHSSAPLLVRLDLMVFLLLPAALAPVAFATVQGWQAFVASLGAQSLGAVAAWYLFAFVTAPLTTWVLVRTGTPVGRAVVQAHLFLAYGIFWVVAAARAAWSVIRGDRSWAKTSRAPSPTNVVAETQLSFTRLRVARPARRTILAALVVVALFITSTAALFISASSAIETYSTVTNVRASEVTTALMD